MGMGHHGLMRAGQRNTPRTAVNLHLEKPWRHRCLAVGCQLDLVRIHEALHPCEIVLDAIAIKNCRRQAQVFVQKIPAEMNDGFARHRHGKVAESLVQMADLLFSRGLYAVSANDHHLVCEQRSRLRPRT